MQNANSPAWSALSELADKLFMVSSDYKAPDADPPGLVSKALKAEFGVEVVPVRDTGHLLQIERPEGSGSDCARASAIARVRDCRRFR